MKKFDGTIEDFKAVCSVDGTTKKTITIEIEKDGKLYGEVLDASGGFIVSADTKYFDKVVALARKPLTMNTALSLLSRMSEEDIVKVVTKILEGRI